jgi:hypothetical protein
MKGIQGYSTPNADGGVTVDVEGMLVDAITVLKAGGCPEQEAKDMFAQIWRDCHIEISIPKRQKN